MIVIDVETTGLDPHKHSIVSIGAVHLPYFESADQEPNFFYEEGRVWAGARISKKALKVNGFEKEYVLFNCQNSHEELIAAYEFWLRQFSDITICGHNPAFDRGFLRTSLTKCGYKREEIREIIGREPTHLLTPVLQNQMRRGINPPMDNRTIRMSLNYVLEYVGLKPEPEPHNGLVGAILEAEAYERIMNGRSLFAGINLSERISKRLANTPNFKKSKLPDYLVR